jgi:ribosomal protein S6--L-glutamate ligase
MKKKRYIPIGWREWCELPDLGLHAIKAKVDTGAATSAIHATKVEEFEKGGKRFVRFQVHPLQKSSKITRTCTAELVDKRHVKSSTGHKHERYVIRTNLRLGEDMWEIEITLSKRDMMTYRMLIGRQALKIKRLVVNPSRSFYFGRMSDIEVKTLYR